MNTNPYRRSILLFIVLLAFGLRLFRLDAQSLWYDEGVTAVVAQYDPLRLMRWTADDIQPPLYYLVVSGWGRLAGWSEWSLRFPSAFLGTLLVPLLAVLCLRLTRSQLAVLTAALIAAVHPLLLYHSQEARMYTLLVALGVGAAWCVVGSAYYAEGRRCWLYWAGYVVTAILAVYTHYFAVFLLLALMLAYIVIISSSHHLFTQSPNHPITQLPHRFLPLFANALVFLAFLPWLGILLIRLNADTSYWEGTLNLGEALRAIAIRFTVGETVLEAEAVRWLWLYGGVTVVCLAVLVWDRGQVAGSRWQVAGDGSPFTIHHPSFTILYLLIPIAAVLILASFTPKFNPRYVMIALPGLILLWSNGLAHIADRRITFHVSRFTHPVIRNTQYAILLALLLAGFLRADLNWFANPAFTKDQWRELAAYVRAHRQADEAVLLVSGHTWPIWQYYAPDMEPVRLPDIEILDVNAVLTFANTGDALRQALADNSGIWLVGWQDEVVDPMEVTALQLARAGKEQPSNTQYWGLELHHFTGIDAEQINPEPPIQHSINANFGDQVELLGYTIEPDGDLLLFWEILTADGNTQHAIRNTQFDLHLTGETLTADGLPYASIADRRLSAYEYPTFRWPPGTVAVGRIPAADWAGEGAAPGNYTVHLGVYDPAGDLAGLDVLGEAGQPLGKEVALDVTLPVPTTAVFGENPFSWVEVAPDLFADIAVDPPTVAEGQPLILNVDWWAESLADLTLQLAWKQGETILAHQQIAVAPDLPPVTWQGLQRMRTRHRVHMPPDLPPGEYQLALHLSEAAGESVRIPITVTASNRTFVPPPIPQHVDATLGGEITLLGSETVLPSSVAAGGTLDLPLVWQAELMPSADYTVTVQWLDDTGRPVTQIDVPLPGGSTNWLRGEVVTQTLSLPTPDQPGTYTLIAAVYNAVDPAFPRLRLSDATDYVVLDHVVVSKK